MHQIDPADLTLRPFQLLDEDWALLVGGSDHPNPMTVSWGGFGTLWNRPVATVYVRPTRFTFGLLDGHPEFTLNFLPEEYREALNLCGRASGRDTDKWQAAGLERVPSQRISVPRVDGARLALECRVLSTLDIHPGQFLDAAIEELYPARDYHRAFLGEVLAVWTAEPR